MGIDAITIICITVLVIAAIAGKCLYGAYSFRD